MRFSARTSSCARMSGGTYSSAFTIADDTARRARTACTTFMNCCARRWQKKVESSNREYIMNISDGLDLLWEFVEERDWDALEEEFRLIAAEDGGDQLAEWI